MSRAKQLVKRCGDSEDDADSVDVLPKFSPDLWRVIYKSSHGTEWHGWKFQVVEIEDTNAISDDKVKKLIEWWWFMDCTSLFHFEVWTCDRYGRNLIQLPLTEYFYQDLSEKLVPCAEVVN